MNPIITGLYQIRFVFHSANARLTAKNTALLKTYIELNNYRIGKNESSVRFQ